MRRTVTDAVHAGVGAMTEHLMAAALEDLEFLESRGVGVTEACRRVGWSASGFEKWSDRHGRRDLYSALLRNERRNIRDTTPHKETLQGVLARGVAVG